MRAEAKLPTAPPSWTSVYHELPERDVPVLALPLHGGAPLVLRRHPVRSVWARVDRDELVPIAVLGWQPWTPPETAQQELFG